MDIKQYRYKCQQQSNEVANTMIKEYDSIWMVWHFIPNKTPWFAAANPVYEKIRLPYKELSL